MLEVRASLRLGGFALDVAFEAGPGVTALFGPSGAGKTTVARLVAGLADPDAGRIALDGRVLWGGGTRVAPHARGVATVFQDARLLPHRDVRGNLLYGAADASGLAEVADLLELGPLLDRRTGALSGGEAARVALGRALLCRPRLLILDEPLAALDRGLRAAILPFLERLRGAVPMLYISHAAEEVARLSDVAVFLDRGRVVDAGPLAAVLADPARAARLGPEQAGAIFEAEVRGGVADTPFGPLPAGGEGRKRLRIAARDVVVLRAPPEGASRAVVEAVVESTSGGVTRLRAGGGTLLAEGEGVPGERVWALVRAEPLGRP